MSNIVNRLLVTVCNNTPLRFLEVTIAWMLITTGVAILLRNY